MLESTPAQNGTKRRRSARSVASEAAFRTRIAELGGVVIEPDWLGCMVPHRVVCSQGHSCRPTPSNTQQGHGFCRVCARTDSTRAERAFRERLAELGGQVVGQYAGRHAPVDCLCALGHSCRPIPGNIVRGQGMCLICAGQDTTVAEAIFRARVEGLGGTIVGEYVSNHTPVDCICPQGHQCSPTPSNIQRGTGLCRVCANMAWDVFYVTVNPVQRRLKFGVTSGDPRHRLSRHRKYGYIDIVRIVPNLPSALALERHMLRTLRDAGVTSVQGREYFDISVLTLVLDIVDGWSTI